MEIKGYKKQLQRYKKENENLLEDIQEYNNKNEGLLNEIKKLVLKIEE